MKANPLPANPVLGRTHIRNMVYYHLPLHMLKLVKETVYEGKPLILTSL